MDLNTTIIVYIILYILAAGFALWFSFYKRKKVKDTIMHLTSGAQEIPIEEFMKMREAREGKKEISNQQDFTGIYIIHNVTDDMYYIGQSKNVLKRVSAHFSGSGNGDVYADFKYGAVFTVRAVPLVGSGYNNLNTLEHDAIQTYDACECGYNKNRGSKN